MWSLSQHRHHFHRHIFSSGSNVLLRPRILCFSLKFSCQWVLSPESEPKHRLCSQQLFGDLNPSRLTTEANNPTWEIFSSICGPQAMIQRHSGDHRSNFSLIFHWHTNDVLMVIGRLIQVGNYRFELVQWTIQLKLMQKAHPECDLFKLRSRNMSHYCEYYYRCTVILLLFFGPALIRQNVLFHISFDAQSLRAVKQLMLCMICNLVVCVLWWDASY